MLSNDKKNSVSSLFEQSSNALMEWNVNSEAEWFDELLAVVVCVDISWCEHETQNIIVLTITYSFCCFGLLFNLTRLTCIMCIHVAVHSVCFLTKKYIGD